MGVGRLNLSPLRQANGPVRQFNQIGSHRAMLEGSLLNINPTNLTNLTGD